MAADLLTLALAAFGAVDTGTRDPVDARSGAVVRRVRDADGHPAFLKLTPITLGADAVAASTRELLFYSDLAAEVPVSSPHLLNAHRFAEGTALLLADAGAERPARRWVDTDWRATGAALARLHTMAPPGPEWCRPDALVDTLRRPNLTQINDFWSNELPALDELVAGRDALAAELASQPHVFRHGDCHTGNVLAGHYGPVFCDWQSAGLGRAASDLAFLSVRATPSSVDVPAGLFEAYLAGRPDLDPTAFIKTVEAEELAIFTFQWPPFAAYNSVEGITQVRRRARTLATRRGQQ